MEKRHRPVARPAFCRRPGGIPSMSLLGKVLALLNVLAAVGFFYLATADRAKRQSWAYAVYRHQLAIDGLPLEAGETDPLLNVGKADQIGEGTLRELNQTAGASDLARTQQEEVQKLHDRLKQEVDRADGPAAKRNKLVEILRPLERSSLRRNELADKLRGPADDKAVADLTQRFEEAFSLEALRPVYGPDGKAGHDPEAKRQAIAHLLFNADTDEAWHKRVVTVVGLDACGKEANLQADAFRDMTAQVKLAMIDDGKHFEGQHAAVIKQIQAAADELQARKSALATQQRLNQQHDNLVT